MLQQRFEHLRCRHRQWLPRGGSRQRGPACGPAPVTPSPRLTTAHQEAESVPPECAHHVLLRISGPPPARCGCAHRRPPSRRECPPHRVPAAPIGRCHPSPHGRWTMPSFRRAAGVQTAGAKPHLGGSGKPVPRRPEHLPPSRSAPHPPPQPDGPSRPQPSQRSPPAHPASEAARCGPRPSGFRSREGGLRRAGAEGPSAGGFVHPDTGRQRPVGPLRLRRR